MRRLILFGMLALAGCGSEPGAARQPAPPPVPPGDYGPDRPGTGERARPEAPPRREPPAAVAGALEAGQTGVVGVEGAVGVRPDTLEVSADGTLEDLRWSSWGPRTAEGAGTLRLRDCDPTCASGGIEELEATVRLSSPRLCGRATYFDRAVVVLGGDAPPATYVRAPC